MRRAPTVCIVDGCYELAVDGGSECERHRKQTRRAIDSRRFSARARGYDARWQRTRKRYLREHPTCEDESGCSAPATDVDHRDGLGPKGPAGHDFSNLRALCRPHHSERTARDQPAGWNKR